MKKFQILFFIICTVVFSVALLEIRYGVVSAYIEGDYTKQEKEKYLRDLHDAVLERKDTVTLLYRGDGDRMEEFVTDSIKNVFAVDDKDTSSDYDYMRYVHKATHINMSGWGGRYHVTYEFEYLESLEETKQVDQKVKKILKKIINKNMTRYEKIKTIHDYIVDHVEYDTSTNYNSPYHALVNGSSACQGYANLLYKMLTEVGIPCRVVTGTAKGGLHAWNMVKLEGKWYNIDTTWDDPVGAFGQTNLRYDYFLKSDRDMKDHVKDPEFLTDSFCSEYPMAVKSY